MSKGTATRQAVLDEAARVASRVGLDGLTIGSLAAATQLSKSGLFAHFQSKESLQLQLLDPTRARFVDLVVRPARAPPQGWAEGARAVPARARRGRRGPARRLPVRRRQRRVRRPARPGPRPPG